MTKVQSMKAAPKRARRDDGAVAVETALTMAPFIFFLAAAFEIAILFFAANGVHAAASELADRGRDRQAPADILAAWSSEDHPFLFARQMTISFGCYSGAQALGSGGPETDCTSAKLITWKVSLPWHAATTTVDWMIPDGAMLTANGVSYR